MNRYQVFRSLKGERIDQHIRQHELIDVVMGEDVFEDDVENAILSSIMTDMTADERNSYKKDEVDFEFEIYNPEEEGFRVKRYVEVIVARMILQDMNRTVLFSYNYGVREVPHIIELAW